MGYRLLIEALEDAKEALMNRDPHTRTKECYDSGHTPCKCTLCKINKAIHANPAADHTEQKEAPQSLALDDRN